MDAECGTRAGYRQHQRFEEQPCPDCCAAESRRTALAHWRAGRHRGMPRCHDCGSIFLEHACAAPTTR